MISSVDGRTKKLVLGCYGAAAAAPTPERIEEAQGVRR